LDLRPFVVARKIIEIARMGERDPDRLCQRALAELKKQRAGEDVVTSGWPPLLRRLAWRD
jgi:hypothetical protein